MLRLLYCSRADIGEAEFAVRALRQILDASRRNNARDGVTGALMFSAGGFAQILEGPNEAVARIFERVRQDTRHHDVAVVFEAPTTGRLFKEWSMGFTANGAVVEAEFTATRAAVEALAPATFRRCYDEPGQPAAMDMLRLIRMASSDVQIW